MLHFFRKHQRYFFVIITIVIVISFSFFGTYTTLSTPSTSNQIAFTAVDGSKVTKGELDALVYFISSDSEDKIAYGNSWGPNFLSDGVLKNDFLVSGLASVLIENYFPLLQDELQKNSEKEKRYKPYEHPQAKFISSENAWNYFAPEITSLYTQLREALSDGDSASPKTAKDIFSLRGQLFLAQNAFSPSTLRQVLRFQEKQYKGLQPDPALNYTDLSLFGYRNVEEWFGPRFLRLAGEFIINTAKIAEKRGYEVTREEALVDLVKNAEESFAAQSQHSETASLNPQEYFKQQLLRMGLNQANAVSIWRQVMLFRRIIQDVGHSVFTDPLIFQDFEQYAKTTVEGDLFQVPKILQLADFKSLQQLEYYLDAVTKRENSVHPLALPKKYKPVETVLTQVPELAHKIYVLEVAEVNKRALQTKVGIKDTWNWEGEIEHWPLLQKQFSELADKSPSSKAEQIAILDALDSTTRSRVDAFARESIIDEHPDWISSALESAPFKRKTISLRLKGGISPFSGLEDRQALIELLDQASISHEKDQSNEKDDVNALNFWTADHVVFYHIKVIDRTPEWQILTFEEAQKDGTLEALTTKKLQAYYESIQKSDPNISQYQRSDKTFKDLKEVRDIVAQKHYEKILNAIKDDYSNHIASDRTIQKPLQNFTGDSLAPYRLYWQARMAKEAIQANPAEAQDWFSEATENVKSEDSFVKNDSLENQWKFIKSSFKMNKSNLSGVAFSGESPFELNADEWSSIQTPVNGEISFYWIKSKGIEDDRGAFLDNTITAFNLLGKGAQSELYKRLIDEMNAKSSISLDYMHANE